MSRIVIAEPRSGQVFEADFSLLVDLVKGSTVVSLADSDRFIEFGLSENLLLRVEANERGLLQVTVVSTLNSDEVPATRLRIVEEGEEPSAALVEKRLHSLRQVYAIIYLLNSDRAKDLAAAIGRNPSVDIERELLKDEERLYLEAAGPGSLWVTVLTHIKGAVAHTTLNTLSLFYGEGRGMLLERVRAGTNSQKGDAAAKHEDVVAKAIANDKARMMAAIEVAKEWEKIENPETRRMVQQILYSNASTLNPKSAALLPLSDSSP